MSARRFAIKFSGVGSDAYHDGQIKISYFNVFSAYNADEMGIKSSTTSEEWSGGKTSYSTIFPGFRSNSAAVNSSPMIQNYTKDSSFNLTNWQGLCALTAGAGNHYSVYRREYEVYERPGVKITGYYYSPDGQHYYFYEDESHTQQITPHTGWYYIDKPTMLCYTYSGQYYKLAARAKVFTGTWEPVLIKGNTGYFYDFNVTSGRSYQYIMYPADSLLDNDDSVPDSVTQIFANSISDTNTTYRVWEPNATYGGQGKMITGTLLTANRYGEPVVTNWDTWSICELEPVEYDSNIPIIKGAYKANLEQLWLFKYSLETGSQTQNISRNEFQTLGQFPKIGFGESNYMSGEVSALLGEEIIPYSGQGYIERLRSSRLKPLSTNERTKMLQQWRKLVNSKNPKLLRDIKGQSWIVQIMGGSNTPKNFYLNQPDTISFQWKQVESTDNVIIYAEIGDSIDKAEAKGSDEWEPMFKNGVPLDE